MGILSYSTRWKNELLNDIKEKYVLPYILLKCLAMLMQVPFSSFQTCLQYCILFRL